MPKTQKIESVLHDWVHELPFQMQALLLTSIRGADGNTKHNPAKCIVRYLRGIVLKPAGNWDGTNNNDFMWGEYDKFESFIDEFLEEPDSYPHHFIMHLTHCAEVIGYKLPKRKIAVKWLTFYNKICKSFHMTPETQSEMEARLNDFGCGYKNLI